MIDALLLAGIGFSLFLISHFLWFHWRKPINRWRSVTRFFLFFLLLYSIIFWLIPLPNWFALLNLKSPLALLFAWANGAMMYIFLFLSYAQFYFLIDRGVSARIMVEIERSPEKRLRIEEIHQRYNPKDMQTRRIKDMLYGGYLMEENGYYKNTKKGALYARLFGFCKKFLHLFPGG